MTKSNQQRKFAVIGTGKTGGTVAELLGEAAIPFDEYNKPTPEKLAEADSAIIFVPGTAAEEIIEILLQTDLPAVWGTTGYQWPEELPDQVKEIGTRWVIGSNFSLGMNLVRKSLNILGKGSEFLDEPKFHIHEVHHEHKQDAPSGTALSWNDWLGKEASISSDRQGDVKGIHELHLKTKGESIFLKHEAHERSIFAEGAIWTANYILDHPEIEPGVYPFSELFDRAFKELL
ncbi:MAG: dihydrodipicolinate reductase C-terminal domain-containing protein [Balneolaceae bacterium]|nr:dihydrodipicolinate reductase C-terminal domain-containing protein [Balneolaceae bacterium]MDR9408614.1 dihydrodipicolinate reductase C-terminal domain-containing protein [Balneolaceae bacterium]